MTLFESSYSMPLQREPYRSVAPAVEAGQTFAQTGARLASRLMTKPSLAPWPQCVPPATVVSTVEPTVKLPANQPEAATLVLSEDVCTSHS